MTKQVATGTRIAGQLRMRKPKRRPMAGTEREYARRCLTRTACRTPVAGPTRRRRYWATASIAIRFRSALLLSCLATLALAPSAYATYPGGNGKIAYELTSGSAASPEEGGNSSNAGIFAVMPGQRPSALLQCSGLGASPTECQGGGDCPYRAPYPPQNTLCLDNDRAAFSADGTELAFANDTCPNGFCRRISIIAADGGNQTTLPALTTDDSQPAFLRSGGLVFTGRATPGGEPNLYEVSLTGTGLSQLTPTGGSGAAPCRNGAIAFVHKNNVYLLSADGRSRRRLTASGGLRPDCSPDSRSIVFLRAVEGRRHGRSVRLGYDVYTITTMGTELRRLSSQHIAAAPSFSPDGRQIAFTALVTVASNPCGGVGSKAYLEIVDMRGRQTRRPIPLGSGGTTQDCFGYFTDPGGASWQPLPDQ